MGNLQENWQANAEALGHSIRQHHGANTELGRLSVPGIADGHGHFATTKLNLLTVGHTHEDVDRLFALILLLVLRPLSWGTPKALHELTKQALTPFCVAKKEELVVEEIGQIRDFDTWLGSMGIQLHSAFVSRSGREASHSFTYKVRADLTVVQLQSMPRRKNKFAKYEEDVFAVAKATCIWSRHSPHPVLAIPH